MQEKFFHHLRDTIILLGGPLNLANLVAHYHEISSKDVLDLMVTNSKLIDLTKDKLVNINKLEIISGNQV